MENKITECMERIGYMIGGENVKISRDKDDKILFELIMHPNVGNFGLLEDNFDYNWNVESIREDSCIDDDLSRLITISCKKEDISKLGHLTKIGE